jgi:hypothetical protein
MMHSAIDLAEADPDQTEVTSFVVLPPAGPFRAEAALRGIEAFLASRFPGLLFYASADAELFEGDYRLVPICGVPGDQPDTLRMLDYPPQALLLSIEAALKLFRPAGLPLN